MPLPVGHALVGAALAEALLPSQTAHRNWKIMIFGCLAVTPDLDFLAVWVFDVDRDWHRGFTHSLTIAIIFGCLMLVFLGRWRVKEAAVCALAVMSHGVLDALTTISGRGIELLWPFSSARYKWGLIDLWEPGSVPESTGQILIAMLQTSVIELITLVPVFLTVFLIRRNVIGNVSSR